VSAELERSAVDALAERWRDAWEGGGFEACCTPDVTYEDPVAVDLLRGVEALDNHAAGLRQAFPDLKLEATAPPLVRGANACVPWRALGTHRADIGVALPATDRFVTLHGLHYLELADGAVRRARGFFDLYDAATQLGRGPSPGLLDRDRAGHAGRVHVAHVLVLAGLVERQLEGVAFLHAASRA
jgi:hypothetical protein